MNKSEATPFYIQTRISYEERLENARCLAKEERESQVLKEMNKFYSSASTDNKGNKDREEINEYMSL